MNYGLFVGEVVKTVVRTTPDLSGQLGTVIQIGLSQVCVEFAPGRVYWIDPDLLADAGSALPSA